MDKDQSLINFLIEETMTLSQGRPKENINDVISLEAYFERSRRKSSPESSLEIHAVANKHEILKHLSVDSDLTTIRGIYREDLACFRFKTNLGWMDLPHNWSCFAKLREKIKTEEESLIIIHWENDIHHLLDVFGSTDKDAWVGMMVLWLDGELKLVGFKASATALLSEIRNLFETNILPHKKVA